MKNTTNTKIINALYNDDDILLVAVKKVVGLNYKIKEIFTPFPVHGLDKAMGLKKTRLAIASFFYGCIGLSFATIMMYYIMIYDWPRNIGGKPSFTFLQNMPAFVPIMFEMTVFFAAHLMVLTFFFRSKLYPHKEAENPDVRTTDDHFLMQIEIDEQSGQEQQIIELLKQTGAVEVNVSKQ